MTGETEAATRAKDVFETQYDEDPKTPYTALDIVLVILATIPLAFAFGCLSATPRWLAQRHTRVKLLLWLIASELLLAAILAAAIALISR